MQLATKNFDQDIDTMSMKLRNASGFLDSIDEKGNEASTHSFYLRLNGVTEFFPSLSQMSLAFSVRNFDKRTNDDRIQLKRSVKEDITPLLSIARDFVESPKLLFQKRLPTDPEQCALKLKEIKEQKEQEIERLKSELDDINGAVHLAESLGKIKRTVSLLDDARFASVPDAAPCVKKQRV
jgi:hypothetical protein